ncbi:CoA-transferase [Micromonospora sp. NBC_00858]|uniref:CoA-transferase n=1 Tax=Micromonospora sp. NBC_00858 TaxID=2975979 RepID=UPI0038697C1C|nr:hypothetical protein OG990_05090 [Micromonospora sp. NBC_00858]
MTGERRRGLGKDELAARVARDIPRGAFVNLGIGLPTRINNHLSPGSGIVLHTENGMLGMGPEAQGDAVDLDLINAGKVRRNSDRCISMGVALCGGMPPRRWEWPANGRGRLAGMQPEAAESSSRDTDAHPAVPVTVSADAAGQIPANLGQLERHPIDAPITQSSADGSHRLQTAGCVLVGHDGDPICARGVHGHHDA